MVFKQNKDEKTVISIRLDTKLLSRIDDMACEKELSRNEVICQGITYALDEEARQSKLEKND